MTPIEVTEQPRPQVAVTAPAPGDDVEVTTPGPQGLPGDTLYFDVTNYGASGDGVTDDTTALAAAAAAAAVADGVVYLPDGTYLTAEPLRGDISYLGQSRNAAVKAHADLVDADAVMLLDLGVNYDADSFGKFVKNLTLDGAGLAGVQLVASSLGHIGNGRKLYETVAFINAGDDVFALGPGPTGSDPGTGMFVGSTFLNCDWDACAHAIELAVSSDDVSFINPRFRMKATVAANNVGPYIYCFAGNVSFKNIWLQVGQTGWTAAGVSCFLYAFGVEAPVAIRGFNIEGFGAACDFEYLILALGPYLTVEDLAVGISAAGTTNASLVALIAAFVSTGEKSAVSVRNIQKADAPEVPVLGAVISTGAPAGGGRLSYAFEGIDQWPDPMVASGDANATDSLYVHGLHQGKHYAHSADRDGWNAGPKVLTAI